MEFDLGTIVFMLAFLWFIISEVRPKAKRPQQRPPPKPRPPAQQRAPERMPYGPRGYEGELEARLAEERRREAARRALEGSGPPVVVSMETPPDREMRELVDYDDAAEAAVQRRIVAATARDRALNAADHAAFDRRIRTESAAARTGRRRGPADGRRAARGAPPLREAIVWREVLGPPVSLRDE